MTGDLAARPSAPVYRAEDHELDELTLARLAEAVPENTRLAYARARDQYEAWCAQRGRTAVPATEATFTAYISHMITCGAAPATIAQHMGAIRTLHTAAGHEGQPPTKRAITLLRAYRRDRAADGDTEDKAPPILRDTLEKLIDTLDLDTNAGRRDQLLLVLGFTMMARRAELAAIQIGDVAKTPDGIEVAIRTSKTDKDSRGAVVALPPSSHPELCPVQLVPAWVERLGVHGITEGPLLRAVTRHGHIGGGIRPATVNDIVQRLAAKAGLPNAEKYSAHSLRAGGLTAALRHGVPLGVAAEHGRWSVRSPVVVGYARTADRWRDNAMRGVL